MNREIVISDLEDIYSREIQWKSLQGKTFLITGAYGMLASYLVFMLCFLNNRYGLNIKIIAQGRSKEKFESRFGKEGSKDNLSFTSQTIDDAIKIDGKIDYIVHAASYASPNYYSVCPVDVLKPNVIGTYNLLRLGKEKNVEGFLMFSSGDVYGNVKGRGKIAEDDEGTVPTLDVHSCYSESKRMAETMCYSFYYQHNVPVKILRIWHTYSPTMNLDEDPRVFSSFMSDLLNGRDIRIKGNGTGRRTFCYIADAVAGYFTVLLNGKVGQAYNICNTDEFKSISELAEIIASLDKQHKTKVVYEARDKKERYVENNIISDIAPDNERLKMLGWSPHFSVAEGFRRVADYYGYDV